MTLPPRLLVLTDRTLCPGPLAPTVSAAVDAGARAVVLREKDLPPPRRRALAEELAAILEPVGGLLILAGTGLADPTAVHLSAVHRSAVHLSALHLSAADVVPRSRPALLGRSCHDLAEVTAAADQGCDYVTVSPVFATASKPGYGPALGLDRLAVLCRRAPPAYALGGVGPNDAAGCVRAGARGVAVMGPVMRDPTVVAAYLVALSKVAE